MMGSDEEVGGAFSRSLGIPLAACTYVPRRYTPDNAERFPVCPRARVEHGRKELRAIYLWQGDGEKQAHGFSV